MQWLVSIIAAVVVSLALIGLVGGSVETLIVGLVVGVVVYKLPYWNEN